MNSPLSVSADEREPRAPFPGNNAQKIQQPYKFSPEELRVLRECNKESFFQRCVPLSTLFGTAAYYGVTTGKFSGSARWGAAPKVIAAIAVGYFMGKFSYQRRCAEKLMELPNSQIGQILRQRKKGILQEGIDPGFGPSMSLSPFSGMMDSYSDINPNQNADLDLDTDRPQYDGLDDTYRPSMDNPITIQEEELPAEQKHSTSYEELRKKNREEYENKKMANYRDAARDSAKYQQLPISPPSRPNYDTSTDDLSKSGPKNKYGDVWV